LAIYHSNTNEVILYENSDTENYGSPEAITNSQLLPRFATGDKCSCSWPIFLDRNDIENKIQIFLVLLLKK